MFTESKFGRLHWELQLILFLFFFCWGSGNNTGFYTLQVNVGTNSGAITGGRVM